MINSNQGRSRMMTDGEAGCQTMAQLKQVVRCSKCQCIICTVPCPSAVAEEGERICRVCKEAAGGECLNPNCLLRAFNQS